MSGAGHRFSAHTISSMLGERIGDLAPLLLPKGRDRKGRWHCGNVAGDPGESLCVEMNGERRGLWLDRATNEGGDALELVKATMKLDTTEAALWGARFLGLGDLTEPREARSRTSPAGASESLRWSPGAQAIWDASEPLGGTAAVYFAARRVAIPWSPDVRFLADAEHWPSKTRWPAILSRVTDFATGWPLTLHFTFLAPDGRGKAPVGTGHNPRLLLPGHQKKGGVIRLTEDAEVTTGLGLAEGIETALAVIKGGWRPVWAAIDAGNLAELPVVSGIESLTIFADHDALNPKTGKRPGIDAANQLAQRWRAARREARIHAPAGERQDWCDVLGR